MKPPHPRSPSLVEQSPRPLLVRASRLPILPSWPVRAIGRYCGPCFACSYALSAALTSASRSSVIGMSVSTIGPMKPLIAAVRMRAVPACPVYAGDRGERRGQDSYDEAIKGALRALRNRHS